MIVETQKFDDPAIDWTKANLLKGTRAEGLTVKQYFLGYCLILYFVHLLKIILI